MFSTILKKVLLKYKVAAAFIVLLTIFCIYTSCKGNYSISVKGLEEKYEGIFNELFSGFEGEWTEQKEKKLSDLQKKMDKVSEQHSELTFDLLNKRITEETYYKFVDAHKEMERGYESSLQEIADKAYYVQEKPDQRYMMKTDGWKFYFMDQTVCYVILVLLFILCIQVFSGEIQSGMIHIYKFSRMGKNKILYEQWLCVLFVGEVFTVSLHLLKLMIYCARYHMTGFSYPIQSIDLFEKCPWKISVGGLVITGIVVQMVATVLFCGLTYLVVFIMKRNVESFFTVFLLIILPAMSFKSDILCRIPNLYELLFPVEMLCGYENYSVFVSLRYMAVYMLISVLASLLFVYLADRKGERIEW